MKKISKIARHFISVSCVALALASAPAYAQENNVVTLSDAVGSGVLNNPEYGVVANNRRATDEELRQAKGLFLPSVDLNADTGYEYSDDPGTRGGLDNDDEESLYRNDIGITVTQMLFDGFESWNEKERQYHRVRSAANRVLETTELLGLSIVEAYMEVLRQRELLRIARANVSEHISILEQINDSAIAGRTTQADVEQARARLASARANEANVREALRVAEAEYNANVGEMPGDLVVPTMPTNLLRPSVDEEVEQALFQSPTIAVFNADLDVADSEAEKSRENFYPEVDLRLNARTGEDLNGIEDDDTSASALVVANWNLYRGGIDTALVRENINRVAEAKERRAQAARAIENDVRQTWAQMVAAADRSQQFAAQAAANVEVVKAYRDQFDLNRRTLLDVLDSQNELFVSRSNSVNEEFLEMIAVYRLLALKSELLPTLNVSYPNETKVSEKDRDLF